MPVRSHISALWHVASGIAWSMFVALIAPQATAQTRLGWGDGYADPGTPVNIKAMATFDDGSGPALYAGGSFSEVDGVPAYNVAKWNGHRWSAVGQGLSGTFVNTLAVATIGGVTSLYAGGSFGSSGGTPVANIARWNGVAWSAVGGGFDAYVDSLSSGTVAGVTYLYAAGAFLTASAGTVPAARIARWNGTAWSALGAGLNHEVYATTIASIGGGADALYAAGPFNNSGSTVLNGIAKWNGTSWSALSTGISGNGGSGSPVNALVAFNDGTGNALIAAGQMSTAGGVPVSYMAKWSGTAWSALGTGLDGFARSAIVHDDGAGTALFVGGQFQIAGGLPAPRVARWNGTAWSATAGGPYCALNSSALALARYDDGSGTALFAGSAGVAKWAGGSWSSVGSGISGPVAAFAAFNSGSGPDLYVTGTFTGAGATSVSSLARKTSSGWTSPGDGMQGNGNALCVHNDGSGNALYVGGAFTQVGGSTVPALTVGNLAKWNGTAWSGVGAPLNTGNPYAVYALASFNDGSGPALYAAGIINSAGATTLRHIGRWNGTSWSAVGSAAANPNMYAIYALTVFNDGTGPALYAGGAFTTIGGVPANNVAKWSGGAWQPVGAGLDASVSALAIHNDGSGPALYAGGDFNSSGGTLVHHIARWTGTSWVPLGAGVDGINYPAVRAIASWDDDGPGPAPASLYAGGWFTTAGGQPAASIARWNGSSWTALGAGTTSSVTSQCVSALLPFDADGAGPAASKLFVGGSFTTAGGTGSSRIAEWRNLGPSFLSAPAVAAVGLPATFSLHSDLGSVSYIFDLSVTGTAPGILLPGNFAVPLNPPYLNLDYGPMLPGLFVNFIGNLGADGQGYPIVNVPNDANLAGYVLSSCFVTVDPNTPSGLGTVSVPGATVISVNPILTSVVPATAPLAGGVPVTITGSYVQPGAGVRFGGNAATNVVVGAGSVTCTVPTGVLGACNVTVTNPDTTSATLNGAFTYVLPLYLNQVSPASATAGSLITLSGGGFQPGLALTVGGVAVTPQTVGAGSVTFLRPAGVPCGTTIQVHNPDSQTASIGFNPSPFVTNTFGANGPAAGGGSFFVVGNNFHPGTTVTVGGTPAVIQSQTGITSMTIIAPPGSVGAATVVITSPGGCSANTTYTYN